MLIYLAARYSRHPEMQAVAHTLQADGHTITSRWIWGEHQALDATLLHPDVRSDAQRFAEEDLADLEAAECFIGFSEALRTASRGGRCVELGMALMLKRHRMGRMRRICVVGGLEHVFHTLPGVEHYASVEEVRTALAAQQPPWEPDRVCCLDTAHPPTPGGSEELSR
jgi:hypothetical protein